MLVFYTITVQSNSLLDISGNVTELSFKNAILKSNSFLYISGHTKLLKFRNTTFEANSSQFVSGNILKMELDISNSYSPLNQINIDNNPKHSKLRPML
ncbi:hypothetical protein GJ496_004722 [Pomphorhynchus laevis]|nr:hypothetical protein GJ496_004722 [Pomphorhynchus laevis]